MFVPTPAPARLAPGWVTRLWFKHHTENHFTGVRVDWFGRGEFQPYDTKRPIGFWRNPVTGAEPVWMPALEEVRLAFTRLPQDDRTMTEVRDHVARMDQAVRPFLGTWYIRGDSSHYCRVWVEGQGPRDRLVRFETETGERFACSLSPMWISGKRALMS